MQGKISKKKITYIRRHKLEQGRELDRAQGRALRSHLKTQLIY